MKFDANIDTAPATKPVWAPKQAAVMIMTAQIGFTVGMAKKAALEATAMAHIDAKATSSRAEGLRRSNEIKNGTHAAIIITNAEM